MSSNSSSVLIALLTVATLIGLTGYQVTSETSAVRLLGRLGAAMVELDRWLPVHRDDIELLARDRPSEPVVLSNLPLEVAIPANVALEAPEAALSATITEAMGRRLYEDGYGAIRDEQGENHLSVTEPLRWSIGALDSSSHGFWRIGLLISGLALVAVTVAHFWMRQSPLPGIAIGSAIYAILAFAVWLVIDFFGSALDGAIDNEIASVAGDGVWIGLRNGLAAAAIGLGGLYAYNSLLGSKPEQDWDEWEDFEYEEFEPESREAPRG